MSKSGNKARWDICEQCWEAKHPDGTLVRFINRNRDRQWFNPLRSQPNLFFIRLDPKLPCNFCKFKLEHSILDQEFEDE